jgi:hypothetical protein
MVAKPRMRLPTEGIERLWIGEMLLLQPVNRYVSVWLLFNSLTIILLPSSSLVQGQGLSSFDFRTFNSTDKLLTSGDAVYNSSSIWLNSAYAGGSVNYSCGGVVYADSVQMRDSSGGGSPAVASFNASFTFSMTGRNSAGMAFAFLVENHPIGGAGSSLCLRKFPNGDPNNQLFAVEFDTSLSPWNNDPSNNHVGVNVNSMDSVSFYNLCGDGIKDCSYLVTGEDFTSWVDYDSATQTVDVFFTKGSLILGALAKPAYPIIHVPNLNLSNVFNDYMFVGITGSAATYREVKNIKSWSFRTGSFGPTQGSKSKSSRGGLIAGSVAAASCVLIAAVLCILYILLCRRTGGAEEPLSTQLSSLPNMAADNHVLWCSSVDSPPAPSKREGSSPLHIFISHTGGPNGAQKNFAISLSAALESSAARLQYNYVVFIDRQMKKGTLFPPELLQQIESTDVALVVVTEEYFQSWWPMWELVKFVELYMKNTQAPKVRVLPLFYKLTTRQVRSFLSEQGLEEQWRGMSTESHPIDVQEYRRAVETLCILNGIEYNFKDYSHDAEYIEPDCRGKCFCQGICICQ